MSFPSPDSMGHRGQPAATLHALVDHVVADYEAKLYALRSENDTLRRDAALDGRFDTGSSLPGSIRDSPAGRPPVSIRDSASNRPGSIRDSAVPPPPVPHGMVPKGMPARLHKSSVVRTSVSTVAPADNHRTSVKSVTALDRKTEWDLQRLDVLAEAEETKRRRAIRMEDDLKQQSLYPMNVTDNLSGLQLKVHCFISWWPFDAAVGLVIMFNAITIGVETSAKVQGGDTPQWIKVVEAIFLCIYIIELSLRFFAVGIRSAMTSHWVKFDCVLVFSGIMDTLLKMVASGMDDSFMEEIILARFFRLMRLVRATRLMYQFRTLWLLVQGLYCSMLTMCWTFLIMTAVIYVFAVMGMELIRATQEYGEEYTAAQSNFNTLSDAMMTLIQMMTLDDIADIYRPIITNRPELSVFFFFFIMLGPITLMNLVTAIIVESSLRQVTDDNEAKRIWKNMKLKQIEPMLTQLFEGLDTDGSGSIELEEITEAPGDIQNQLKRVCKRDDLEETFKMLDYDDSGKVNIQEFIRGVMRVTDNKPAELVRIVKQCSDILQINRRILNHVEASSLGSKVPSPVPQIVDFRPTVAGAIPRGLVTPPSPVDSYWCDHEVV